MKLANILHSVQNCLALYDVVGITLHSSGRAKKRRAAQFHVTMIQPRQIYSVTVDDLRNHRWCYFHDDEAGFDAFEYVIPDAHPKFDENIMELELARFTFAGGHTRYGKFDGSKCFSVFLKGEWFSLWSGVSEPSQDQIDAFRKAMFEESLSLPVIAVARWSGASTTYGGLRHYNKNDEEYSGPRV